MEMEPCKVAIKEYPNTRRCFITGEYCSKQTDISKVRKTLYSKNKSCKADENDGPQHSSAPEINAFVVMNFSNMSDVAYEQRIKPFVESLTKYFYFSEDGKSISCFGNPQDAIQQDCDVNHDNLQNTIKPVFKDEEGNTYFGVEKINVVRADSNFASNFVICNRVCQQMQMADLIVVDVSVKNANVFYELGFRQAFNMKTVLIKDKKTAMPFDISSIRTLSYSETLRIDEVEKGRIDIQKALEETEKSDSNDVNSLINLLSINKAEIPKQQNLSVDTSIILNAINDLKNKSEGKSSESFIVNSETIYIGDEVWFDDENGKALEIKATFLGSTGDNYFLKLIDGNIIILEKKSKQGMSISKFPF